MRSQNLAGAILGFAISGFSGAAFGQTPPPASVSLPVPRMAGSLAFNSVPYSVDTDFLGKWYVDGVFSGAGLVQSSATASDRTTLADVSNGQIFLQKLDGIVQFYAQIGAYALPSLGLPYSHVVDSANTLDNFFGVVPEGFVKIAPNDHFSVQVGKLPTLIGAECNFTFENLNIERGLLWVQEAAVSRGVQANDTIGAVVLSVSLNDGYYSNRYNWLSGSASWTINPSSTLVFAAGGNLGRTGPIAREVATPTAQNNSFLYNAIFTYNAAPWTITPYLQFSHVGQDASIGIAKGASTYGGAVLGNYVISPAFQLAGRVEYIGTSGSKGDLPATNLLYGPGSGAFSVTLTPSFAHDRFFARADVSLVGVTAGTAGSVFGRDGRSSTQFRGLVETGIIF